MQIQSLEIDAVRKLLTPKGLAVCLFARAVLEADDKGEISSEVLFLRYIDWATENKQPIMSKIAFGRLLENATGLYPTSSRSGGDNVRLWHGLKLKGSD